MSRKKRRNPDEISTDEVKHGIGSGASALGRKVLSVVATEFGGGHGFTPRELAQEASLSETSVRRALVELKKLGYVHGIGRELNRQGKKGPERFVGTLIGEERSQSDRDLLAIEDGEAIAERQITQQEALADFLHVPRAKPGKGKTYRPTIHRKKSAGHKLPRLTAKRIRGAGYRVCNPKPGKITSVNLFALADTFKNSDVVSQRVPSNHFAHLKRCLAAGLIEDAGGGNVRITPAGKLALATRRSNPTESEALAHALRIGGGDVKQALRFLEGASDPASRAARNKLLRLRNPKGGSMSKKKPAKKTRHKKTKTKKAHTKKKTRHAPARRGKKAQSKKTKRPNALPVGPGYGKLVRRVEKAAARARKAHDQRARWAAEADAIALYKKIARTLESVERVNRAFGGTANGNLQLAQHKAWKKRLDHVINKAHAGGPCDACGRHGGVHPGEVLCQSCKAKTKRKANPKLSQSERARLWHEIYRNTHPDYRSSRDSRPAWVLLPESMHVRHPGGRVEVNTTLSGLSDERLLELHRKRPARRKNPLSGVVAAAAASNPIVSRMPVGKVMKWKDAPASVRRDPLAQKAVRLASRRLGIPMDEVPGEVCEGPQGTPAHTNSSGEVVSFSYKTPAGSKDSHTRSGRRIVYDHKAGDQGRGKKPTRPMLLVNDPRTGLPILVSRRGSRPGFSSRRGQTG